MKSARRKSDVGKHDAYLNDERDECVEVLLKNSIWSRLQSISAASFIRFFILLRTISVSELIRIILPTVFIYTNIHSEHRMLLIKNYSSSSFDPVSKH